MKRYLYTMLTLLFLALIAGIVVWYFYQELNPAELVGEPVLIEQPESENVSDTATSTVVGTSTQEEVSLPAQGGNNSYTISADSLTPTQQTILRSLGFETDEMVVTDAMITCARNEVGEERLKELLNGGAPTPREAFGLAPCLRK